MAQARSAAGFQPKRARAAKGCAAKEPAQESLLDVLIRDLVRTGFCATSTIVALLKC